MTAAPVDLDSCAREPIHIPGAIQPHGVLFACREPDLAIRQVSTSALAHLGIAAETLIGTPVADVFDADTSAKLRDVCAREQLREANPLRVVARNGTVFDAVLHRTVDGVLVIELEPVSGDAIVGFDPRLRAATLRLQAASSARVLCEIAAREVRTLTGFDRVMVYRFDDDWHGEVVAEARRDDLEPFLGLHYPASDIPEQARKLYTLNWLRLIADVGYTPSPILPAVDGTGQRPLDLSYSVLRSVSPIHIEYLRNMGVSASMSVSLVIDGKLSGLIACHHYTGPRVVPFRTRDTAEYLGQALSWQLRVLELARTAERARSTREAEADLVRSTASHSELLDGLATEALLALTNARGAAIVLQEGIRRVGDCPSNRALTSLVDWLRTQPDDLFSTSTARVQVPAIDGDKHAGVLSVPIAHTLDEYIIWFRPPTERIVDWAGDPRKVVVHTAPDQPPRLSPRGSFALWRETVRGQALKWESWELEAASHLRSMLLGGIRSRAHALRNLNLRLVDADRAKDDFIATVSHELRTPLNAIVGWVELVRGGKLAAERWPHALEVIHRNARAQVQIVDDLLDVSRMVSGKLALDVETIDFVALVNSVLDSFEVAILSKELRLKRVLDSSATPVLGDTTRLRQLISNLTNNAIKFTPKQGSITVTLRRVESDLDLSIRDSGQGIAPEVLPTIFDLFRQGDSGMNRRASGLGIGLAIAKKIAELHGGRITAASDGVGRGATFTLRIPMSPVLGRATDAPQAAVTRTALRLGGVRVLVVEDEEDARDLVAELLVDVGAEVTAVGSVDAALEAIAASSFDAIISDIGMPGRDGFQLMQAIRRDGNRTPAVALTAYSRAHDRSAALRAGFNAHVPKPVDGSELTTVIASLTGRLVP